MTQTHLVCGHYSNMKDHPHVPPHKKKKKKNCAGAWEIFLKLAPKAHASQRKATLHHSQLSTNRELPLFLQSDSDGFLFL